MSPTPRTCHPARPVAVTALAVGLGIWMAPALAGNLTATASQNTVGSVSVSDPGASASAYWPDVLHPTAYAIALRDSITASSAGGTLVTQALGAAGGASTDYQLWDLGTLAELDLGLASAMTLQFHFQVTGDLQLLPVSVSTAAAAYDAVLYSVGASSAGSFVNGSYGPAPPPVNEAYIWNGDTALIGHYDIGFNLQHVGSTAGTWTMNFTTGAANGGSSSGLIRLTGISLSAGQAPVGGLAVRLETGQLIPVSAVPEPGIAWMWLAGAAMLGLRLRRQA